MITRMSCSYLPRFRSDLLSSAILSLFFLPPFIPRLDSKMTHFRIAFRFFSGRIFKIAGNVQCSFTLRTSIRFEDNQIISPFLSFWTDFWKIWPRSKPRFRARMKVNRAILSLRSIINLFDSIILERVGEREWASLSSRLVFFCTVRRNDFASGPRPSFDFLAEQGPRTYTETRTQRGRMRSGMHFRRHRFRQTRCAAEKQNSRPNIPPPSISNLPGQEYVYGYWTIEDAPRVDFRWNRDETDRNVSKNLRKVEEFEKKLLQFSHSHQRCEIEDV